MEVPQTQEQKKTVLKIGDLSGAWEAPLVDL